MKTEKREYTKIIANEGYFLTNHNGCYGTEIILGSEDSPENYEELPMSEWPVVEHEHQNHAETGTEAEENPLSVVKLAKLKGLYEYDKSNNVNGFYYNGQFMWLDRETRSVLKNTIESLETVGRNTLNIWYGDNNINLNLEDAKYLLSLLEVYATDCYNITEQHRLSIIGMTTVEDVKNYNFKEGYPEMLRFDNQ